MNRHHRLGQPYQHLRHPRPSNMHCTQNIKGTIWACKSNTQITRWKPQYVRKIKAINMHQNMRGRQVVFKHDTRAGVLELSFWAESADIKQHNITYIHITSESWVLDPWEWSRIKASSYVTFSDSHVTTDLPRYLKKFYSSISWYFNLDNHTNIDQNPIHSSTLI